MFYASKNKKTNSLGISNMKKGMPFAPRLLFGGGKRDRTADLLNAIQALSQLSYTPKRSMTFFYHIRHCLSRKNFILCIIFSLSILMAPTFRQHSGRHEYLLSFLEALHPARVESRICRMWQ